MKRWLTLPLIGSGTIDDPIRPDLKGVAGITGYNVVASNGSECLVRMVRDQGPLDMLKAKTGVRSHGDETGQVGPMGQTAYRVSATLRAALRAEATRLGAGPDWRPECYDIHGG